MNEPEEVQRARKLVERGRAVVEEQRQRIERLRAISASTDKAEAMLEHFETTLSILEYHILMVQAESVGLVNLPLFDGRVQIAALGARRGNNEIGVSATPFFPSGPRGQLREESG